MPGPSLTCARLPMPLTPLHKWLLLPAIGLLLHGCALPAVWRKAPPGPPAAPVSARKGNYWQGQGVKGAPRIVIVLSQQRAFFFKGDLLVGETAISSGRKGFETPPGDYKVIEKDKNHVSNLYGEILDEAGVVVKANADMTKDKLLEGQVFQGAKMPNFLRITGGYGLHAGRLPGYRASHGCIRLPGEMSLHFFENAPAGTPVKVME